MSMLPNSQEARDVAYQLHPYTNARTHQQAGPLVIERGDRAIHRDLFFDSFSIGLGAASLETRNRDRERVGRIPGLGAVYRDQLVYAGAVLQRFVESYVVDIKFDVDVVIDGAVHHFEHVLDIIVKNTKGIQYFQSSNHSFR